MDGIKKVSREFVLENVDKELSHMEEKFGPLYLYRNSHLEWLEAMKDYIISAHLSQLSGNPEKALIDIRKIAALSISMLEHKGCPERKE